MALEIEIKLPIESPEAVKEGLRTMGFSPEETWTQEDTYFNSKEFDLRRQDKALRLREEVHPAGGRKMYTLNYKGPKLDAISMSRTELEMEITDPKTMEDILRGLGYDPVDIRVKKERTSFRRGSLTAALDQVEGLGTFLELERMGTDEEDREKGTEKMEQVITELGYSMADTVRTSYLTQLEQKG